jgi:hypothetical protein
MMHLLKNPIVFGALVGVVMCVLLFLHDKFLARKPEEKSSFGTYVKIFLAGFIATAPLVFIFYNQDLSFSKTPKNVKTIVETVQEAGAVLTDHHTENSCVDSVSKIAEKIEESARESSDAISITENIKKIKSKKPKMHLNKFDE